MNEIEIVQCLTQHPLTKSIFKGVFARDELKAQRLQTDTLFIVNTDRREDPGAHWTLFYRSKDGVALYFDSYGMRPLYKEMYDFILKDSEKFDYNTWQLQDVDSSVCGHYVTYFAARLCAGQTLHDIRQNHFSKNKRKLNDRIILTLFRQEFGLKASSYKLNHSAMTCHCLCHDGGV